VKPRPCWRRSGAEMVRPEFYEVELLSHPRLVRLCRCCFAVLVGEGVVAGDPTVPGYVATYVTAARPSRLGPGFGCVTCSSLRAFEEKRSRLAAPPERIGIVTSDATPKSRLR
jgi:hypothetical protein